MHRLRINARVLLSQGMWAHRRYEGANRLCDPEYAALMGVGAGSAVAAGDLVALV